MVFIMDENGLKKILWEKSWVERKGGDSSVSSHCAVFRCCIIHDIMVQWGPQKDEHPTRLPSRMYSIFYTFFTTATDYRVFFLEKVPCHRHRQHRWGVRRRPLYNKTWRKKKLKGRRRKSNIWRRHGFLLL